MTPSAAPAVHIETYGCAFNMADSEAMAGLLRREGYALADRPEDADLVILNTCTVKDRTFHHFRKRLDALRRRGPLVVAGCIPKVYARSEWLDGVALVGPDALGGIVEVVAGVLDGAAPRALDASEDAARPSRAECPTLRRHAHIEILPIAAGCLGACRFCQTRLARGRLRSFPPDVLIERARRAVDEGVRELWITAQDTGAYGRDTGGPTLPELLGRICAIEGDYRIRVGMTNPNWVAHNPDAWLEAWAHPRLFRFLHMPVQSGAERVLRAMGRSHGVEEFETVAAAFHERFPDLGLMTDAIAGYPTETDEDFEATLALLERVRPAAVNRSRFSARPHTPAARLDPLPVSVVKERSRRLNDTVRRLARAYHEARVGRTERVLTSETSLKGPTTLARNDAWRPVVLDGLWPTGVWLDAHYHAAADFHIKAQGIRHKA